MTVAPTPEQFLAQTEPDDEDHELDGPFDMGVGAFMEVSPFDWPNGPLESIAESLRKIAGSYVQVELAGTELEVCGVCPGLNEAYDDLDAKSRVLFELVEEIEGLIKPSTSKLANSVREAIARWRAPVVEPVVGAPQCASCGRYFADQDLLERHDCTGVPANDAPVEEWRAYAEAQGYPEGTVIDQMNRSQIRTLLGVPQTEGTSA